MLCWCAVKTHRNKTKLAWLHTETVTDNVCINCLVKHSQYDIFSLAAIELV